MLLVRVPNGRFVKEPDKKFPNLVHMKVGIIGKSCQRADEHH